MHMYKLAFNVRAWTRFSGLAAGKKKKIEITLKLPNNSVFLLGYSQTNESWVKL